MTPVEKHAGHSVEGPKAWLWGWGHLPSRTSIGLGLPWASSAPCWSSEGSARKSISTETGVISVPQSSGWLVTFGVGKSLPRYIFLVDFFSNVFA